MPLHPPFHPAELSNGGWHTCFQAVRELLATEALLFASPALFALGGHVQVLLLRIEIDGGLYCSSVKLAMTLHGSGILAAQVKSVLEALLDGCNYQFPHGVSVALPLRKLQCFFSGTEALVHGVSDVILEVTFELRLPLVLVGLLVVDVACI